MSEFFQKATWSVEIIVFLTVVSGISYLAVRNRNPGNFTPAYLLSITIKLILSCVFVIVFIVADAEAANYNTVLFLAGYVVFTAAEVFLLLLKKKA